METFVFLNSNQLTDLIRNAVVSAITTQKNEIPQPDLVDPPKNDFLTVGEICLNFSISRPTLYKYRRKYEWPAFRFGRRVYFKKQDVISTLQKAVLPERS